MGRKSGVISRLVRVAECTKNLVRSLCQTSLLLLQRHRLVWCVPSVGLDVSM